MLHIRHGPDEQTTALILHLTPLHRQILTLLGLATNNSRNRVIDRAECGLDPIAWG